MSLYYAVGFLQEFVHVCETEFAIYLEKWEAQATLIASPWAPRSTCCAAAISWCSAEIRGAPGLRLSHQQVGTCRCVPIVGGSRQQS